MTEYPAIQNTSSIKRYLETIQSTGVPPKVTRDVLRSQGFTSSNDRALIPLLKHIKFIDEAGVPTKEGWRAYRDKGQAKAVLGRAIRQGYSDLFAMYPDAHRRDDEAIRNFMRPRTESSDVQLKRMVAAFKALCDLASFEPDESDEATEDDFNGGNASNNGQAKSKTANYSGMAAGSFANGLTLNVNIELHLPATQEAEVYDALFASLRRHLLES